MRELEVQVWFEGRRFKSSSRGSRVVRELEVQVEVREQVRELEVRE